MAILNKIMIDDGSNVYMVQVNFETKIWNIEFEENHEHEFDRMLTENSKEEHLSNP
jgi:hypothetical protein